MYRFRLYDEDDPLAEFAQGYAPDYDTSSPPLVRGLEPPPDSLESLISPDAGSYQPQFPGQDRELEAAYRNRELQAIKSSTDDGYGWAEGIRDVAPAAIGLIVDGIANKGRGAANIVGVTAQQAAGNQAYDRAMRHKEAELAVRLHQRNGNRFNDPYAAEKLRQAEERIRLQGQGQAGVQARSDRAYNEKADPNSATHTAAQNQAFEVGKQREMGSQEGLHAYAPTRAEDAALATTATTQAKLDTEHDNAPRTTDDEAARAAAREAAATHANTDALRANPKPLTEQQKIDNATRERTEASGRKEKHRASSDQFVKESEYARGIASQLDRIDAVMQKYPEGELYRSGVGFGQQFGGEELNELGRGLLTDFGISDQRDALEMASARRTLAEMAQRKESGAAGPEAERLRYLVRTGAQPNATETQFRIAVQAAKDLTRMQLNSYSTGKEDAAREVLEAGNLGGWAPPRPAAPPPGAAPYTAPQWRGQDPGALGAPQAVPDRPPPAAGLDDWRSRYQQWKRGQQP